jgi:hypothetical protein
MYASSYGQGLELRDPRLIGAWSKWEDAPKMAPVSEKGTLQKIEERAAAWKSRVEAKIKDKRKAKKA